MALSNIKKSAFIQQLARSSIEDASILKKFTILFILMSIIPLIFLYYFYLQLKQGEILEISGINFTVTLSLVVVGVGVGYWAMRSVLKQLIDITKANKNALSVVLGPNKLRELSQEKNELAVLARSFHAITSRLEDNIKNLEVTKKTLHSVLQRVGQGISTMQNIDTFLELIVETVVEGFNGRVGVLMLYNPVKNDFYVNSAFGVENNHDLENVRLRIEDGPFTKVLKAKKPITIEEFDEDSLPQEYRGFFTPPILAAPLILHDNAIGILAVSGKVEGEKFQDDEINLMHSLALQTAVAVENSKLNEDAETTYFETISALALAVDAKDRYSRGHLDRVADYVVRIAKKLKLGEDDIKTLRDAARLHDLGKIGVPDEILTKPKKLSSEEMEIMKRHTEVGESIIRPIRSLSKLCDIVRHHHEKLDGSGYPDGLRGDEISLLVRITTVADIYDALTTNRPYRKKFTPKQAGEKLRDMKDQLDQEIVEAFLSTFK